MLLLCFLTYADSLLQASALEASHIGHAGHQPRTIKDVARRTLKEHTPLGCAPSGREDALLPVWVPGNLRAVPCANDQNMSDTATETLRFTDSYEHRELESVTLVVKRKGFLEARSGKGST